MLRWSRCIRCDIHQADWIVVSHNNLCNQFLLLENLLVSRFVLPVARRKSTSFSDFIGFASIIQVFDVIHFSSLLLQILLNFNRLCKTSWFEYYLNMPSQPLQCDDIDICMNRIFYFSYVKLFCWQVCRLYRCLTVPNNEELLMVTHNEFQFRCNWTVLRVFLSLCQMKRETI